MARMTIANIFLLARYVFFGLFIVCNAIICSVAVWNYSLADYNQSIDIYLIFLGALSLVSIFLLVFIELFCLNALTTRVWFECAWVALFWAMELAGGAALIALVSDTPCSGNAGVLLPDALCTSQRLLLAFTWMCTIILLLYLFALIVVAGSRYYREPGIWIFDVRTLRPVAARPSWRPSDPSLTIGFKKQPSLEYAAPRPVTAKSAQVPYHFAGLDGRYEIEPFRPVFVAPEQMEKGHPSNLAEATPLPPLGAAMPLFMKPKPAWPRDTRDVGLRSSIVSVKAGIGSGPATKERISLPSPLGDWPRRDVMQQQPVKHKPKSKPRFQVESRRRSPPPSALEFPRDHAVTIATVEQVSTDGGAQPRPKRPSGPRLRSPSVDGPHRPPPLDLRGISNYESSRVS